MTYEEFLSCWRNKDKYVTVQTSGSTGTPKRMLVEKQRMTASARATCDFLGLDKGDSALLCMSLDYIAGKMMVVRAEERGLKLTVVEPTNRPLKEMSEPFDFIAMIPSQVYETLRNEREAELLRRTKHLIIGGGAISAKLVDELSKFPNNVWSTYGMTETLSHIAMRRLNGSEASVFYTPLSGVDISLNDDNCLVINAPSLSDSIVVTNDIAELHEGGFRIKGRKDNVICSGGIKIHAEEVEALLVPHISSHFAITKVKDDKFGESVVLVSEDDNLSAIETICKQVLPRYWQPRHYFISRIPFTETGKVARRELEDIIESLNNQF